MCRLLFKAYDTTNTDSEKDRGGCYKRGMLAALFEDGHVWGAEEGLPYFWRIDLPNVPAALLQEAFSEQWEDDNNEPYLGLAPVLEPTPQMYRRRRWYLDYDRLPNAAKAAIDATGEYTASSAGQRNQLRSAVRRYRDDAQYTGF